MPSRLFDPGSFRKKVLRKSKSVTGGAILLQKGGPGAGSSYPSVANYEHETGQTVGMEGVNAKLKSLMTKPLKKKHNIKFSIN